MAYDALLVLFASAAQTSSTNNAGIPLGGTPDYGLVARVLVTAVSGTTPTCLFFIQSSDDDSTYTTIATLEGGTINAAGEYFIPFETKKKYVRLATTIAGTTPSFTYSAQVGVSNP